MSGSRTRSDLTGKFAQAWTLLTGEGWGALIDAARKFARYHLRDKWRFVYFARPLDQPVSPVPVDASAEIRVATPQDFPRLQAEIFPLLSGDLKYDQRHFRHLGDPDVQCFIAERNGKLVHYSWVFLDARRSPMAAVPAGRRLLRPGDAFLGPVFTSPAARGVIYLQVLARILRDLREAGTVRRMVLFVDGRNPAAARSFYARLGFQEIGLPRRRRRSQ